MNKPTNKQNRDRLIDTEQYNNKGKGVEGVEGLSTKEKGIMDMDSNVVIAVGRGYKETK